MSYKRLEGEDVKRYVARVVQKKRKRMGMSMYAVSKAANIPEPTVRTVENPSIDSLISTVERSLNALDLEIKIGRKAQ